MAKDANFSNVSLLLHCDGANGSTAVIDSSQYAHAVTVFGGAAISTASMLFGKPSLLFDGAGDYCVLPDTTALELGSGDFTIEFQIKTTQTSAYACPIGRDNASFVPGAWAILLNGPASGAVELWAQNYASGAPLLSAPSAGINNGAWHHVEVGRSSTTWRLFVDGVQAATNTFSGAFADADLPINLGRQPGYSRDFAGNLAQIRITKGLARHTANFTPPAAPFLGAGDLSGAVEDASGTPVSRLVRAIREDTGGFVGAVTSDATTGAYSIPATSEGAHTLIAYPAAGENLPALALRGVVPV